MEVWEWSLVSCKLLAVFQAKELGLNTNEYRKCHIFANYN